MRPAIWAKALKRRTLIDGLLWRDRVPDPVRSTININHLHPMTVLDAVLTALPAISGRTGGKSRRLKRRASGLPSHWQKSVWIFIRNLTIQLSGMPSGLRYGICRSLSFFPWIAYGKPASALLGTALILFFFLGRSFARRSRARSPVPKTRNR